LTCYINASGGILLLSFKAYLCLKTFRSTNYIEQKAFIWILMERVDFDLLTNYLNQSFKKCTEASVENLCVDLWALRVKAEAP